MSRYRDDGWDAQNILAIIGVAGLTLFMGYAFTLKGVEAMTEKTCLAAGYREASVDIFFNRYCIKRLDQTDVVVPLDQVKE